MKMIATLLLISMIFPTQTSYAFSRATVDYSMSVSVTGFPLSLNANLEADIIITGNVVHAVVVMTGTINETFDISDLDDFLVLQNEQTSITIPIPNATVTLTLAEGTETDITTIWYGAHILSGHYEGDDVIFSAKWSKALGILLSTNMRITDPSSGMSFDLSLRYTFGAFYNENDTQVTPYSDQPATSQIGYDIVKFIISPIGLIIITIAAVTIILISVYVVKKNKSNIRSKSRMQFHRV